MKNNLYKAIAKYFDAIETILILVFVISMGLILFEINHAIIVISSVIILLALLYWFMSMEPRTENDTTLKLYTKKLTWISLSLSVLGLLMKLQFDEKANIMLLLGIVLIFISLILNYIIWKKEKEKIKIAVFVRALLFILISLYLYTL